MYEWLLFLHVLSVFAVAAAYVVFWISVLLGSRVEQSLARPMGLVFRLGMLGALVFGVWLAIEVDGYQVWDWWILGAIVLWMIAFGTSERAGTVERARAPLLYSISTLTMLLLLADMIYKPGA